MNTLNVESVSRKCMRIRSRKGITLLAVMSSAIMVLLPLGLFSFEAARAQMASKQLHIATDAAALAAATLIANSTGSDEEKLRKGTTQGLKFFRNNSVVGTNLTNARRSADISRVKLRAGESRFQLVVDPLTGKVTAHGAYGLAPAFAKFLHLNTQTIRTRSCAGRAGLA